MVNQEMLITQNQEQISEPPSSITSDLVYGKADPSLLATQEENISPQQIIEKSPTVPAPYEGDIYCEPFDLGAPPVRDNPHNVEDIAKSGWKYYYYCD